MAVRTDGPKRRVSCFKGLLALLLTSTWLHAAPLQVLAEQALAEEDPVETEVGEAAAGAIPPPTRAGVEEIVVTARKREEWLEEIPLSITAISAATLYLDGTSRLDQIENLVPNLTFVTAPNGVEFNALIRGVGQLEEGEPGVGIYVDGVYLPRAGNALLNVVDIEQIEVLRGPQGSLFGKNTIGGAINITSVQPHEALEASGFVRGGSYDTVETGVTLNFPIAIGDLEDKLFTRLSFASTNSSGYTKNVNPDIDKRYNDRSALWFLGSMLYAPRDDLEIRLSGNWYRDDTRGGGGRCVYVQDPPDPAVGSLVSGAFPDFPDNCRASRNYRFQSEITGESNPTDYGIWGNATWDAGPVGFLDELRLRTIASWRQQSLPFLEDPDMTQDPIVVLAATGGDGEFDGGPREGRLITTETQVHGNAVDGRLVFVGGFYAQWEDRAQNTVTRALEGTPADFFGGTIIASVDQSDWDWALFGQATYDPLDWVSLTAGLRYTWENKGLDRFTVNPFGEASLPGVPQVILDAGDSKSFDAFTPTVSIALRAPEDVLESVRLDHVMGYFTYSRGFKGGGFNQIAFSTRDASEGLDPFQPEYLDSFELGVKTVGFRDRLLFNFSLFLGDYSDIQVDQRVAIPGANPGDLPVIEIVTENAARATVRGFELETRAIPLPGLLLTGSVGLLDSSFDDFVGPSELDSEEQIDRRGESFNNVPKWTTNVTAEYSLPVRPPGPDWLVGDLRPRMDWYYQSKVHYLPPEVTESVQGGYHLLNARLGYGFLDDRAELAFFARNLTDETVFGRVTSIVPIFGFLTRFYQPPRTFGGEVRYRF